MCGRYVSPEVGAIERFWHVGRDNWVPRFVQTFNAAPSQMLPIFRHHPERGPELVLLRWGLIPSWAKEISIGAKMINARSETVAEKPSFRAAFKRRRCLVPMQGFYEWKRDGTRKVPHFIYPLNDPLFAAAGLYEYWPGRDGAEPVESYTILTTVANEMMATIHDRMPVFLRREDHDAWLDPKNEDTAALQKLIQPYPSEEMRAHAVSTQVNSPKNQGEELIERVEGEG